MNKITKAFLEAPLSVLFPDGWTRTYNHLREYVEKDGVKIYLDDLKYEVAQELAENNKIMREWVEGYEVIKSDETALEFCFGNWGELAEEWVETCLEVIEKRVEKKWVSEWLENFFYECYSCLAEALYKLFPEEEIDWELISDRVHKIVEEYLYTDEMIDSFTTEYLEGLARMEKRKDQIKEFLCNMDHEEVMELFKEVTHMKVKKEVND